MSGMGGWLQIGKEGNQAKIREGAPWEDPACQAKEHRLCSLGQGQQTFHVKGHMVKTLGLVDHSPLTQ